MFIFINTPITIGPTNAPRPKIPELNLQRSGPSRLMSVNKAVATLSIIPPLPP